MKPFIVKEANLAISRACSIKLSLSLHEVKGTIFVMAQGDVICPTSDEVNDLGVFERVNLDQLANVKTLFPRHEKCGIGHDLIHGTWIGYKYAHHR